MTQPNPSPRSCRVDVTDGTRSASWTLRMPRIGVGRSEENDIVVHGAAVSRHHFTIEQAPDGLYVVPGVRASRPTVLDGRAITEPTPIEGRAEVTLGAVRLTVVDGGPDRPAPAASEAAAGIPEPRDAPPAVDPADVPEDAHDIPAEPAPSMAGIADRGSVVIGRGPESTSPVGDPGAAAPHRQPAAVRWLRRHWPLALALVIMAGLVAAVFSMERAAPTPKAVVPLCEQPFAAPETPCPGPEACARAASEALAAARRLAEAHVGSANAPRVLVEAMRAVGFGEKAGDAAPEDLLEDGQALVAEQLETLRSGCRDLHLQFRRARNANRDRKMAIGLCHEMKRLFPDPTDPRHRWAQRQLGTLE